MATIRLGLAAASLGALGAANAHAAAFSPGDLVVYRVGDGGGTLANTGNAVFLDEYSPTGTLVQSIAMPTADSGSTHALIASGTATSEGLLSLSSNGQFLALTGYDAAPGGGTSVVSGTAPRTVAVVNANGNVDTTTALTDFAPGNNPRSAVTTDGSTIYVAGAAGGVRITTLGTTTSTQLSTTTTNIRQVNIFAGQLYASSSSGATRVATVGTNLPTASGQTITNLPGITSTNSSSPYSFFLADLSPTVDGLDTLYIADDTAGSGQIQKFSLVSGTWTLNGTIAAAAVRGLAGSASGTSVSLFATTGGSAAAGGGTLYDAIDTAGYNAAPSITSAATLATAATNEAFRGIAFAPAAVPEPTSLGLLCLTGIPLLRRRRNA